MTCLYVGRMFLKYHLQLLKTCRPLVLKECCQPVTPFGSPVSQGHDLGDQIKRLAIASSIGLLHAFAIGEYRATVTCFEMFTAQLGVAMDVLFRWSAAAVPVFCNVDRR